MTTLRQTRDETAAATLMLAGAAALFGLVPLFARELQAMGVGDAAIALYRFGFAALALAPFAPLERDRRGKGAMLFGAGLAVGLGWIGYLEAVRQVPVAAAGVVYMSYPLFVALFAWLLLGQRPGARGLGAAALVLGAAALMLGPAALAGGAAPALLWSVGSPVTFGLAVVVLSAMTPGLGVLEKLSAFIGGAAAGLLPAVLAQDAPAFPGSAEGWVAVAGLGLTTAFVPHLIYAAFAPRVGPSRAAATGALELPTMLAIGWLAFGEAAGLREVAAAAALAIGAIFLAPSVRTPRAALSGASRR
ncbi:MAG: DMT family transporter [Pseudomonadota bacterium]